MTPTEKVHSTILDAAKGQWKDSDVVHMVQIALAIDEDTAALIVRFTKVGWCRVYLRGICGLPIKFSDEFLSFDVHGHVVSRGALSANTWYQAALKVPRSMASLPAFKSFGTAAAEFMAVGQMLNKGSEPRNILTSPAFFLPSNPSEQCISTAEVIMRQEALDHGNRMRAAMAQSPPSKESNRPWWKFW